MMKEKRKILYLITKSNFGGAQRYVYDLATNMPRELFEVAVALGGEGELKERLDADGIRTVTIPELTRDIFLWKDFVSFVKILKLLRQETPHVFHLNSSKAGLMGVVAARMYNVTKLTAKRCKLKAVFTAHGWAFTEDRGFLSRNILKLLQWLTVLLSHATIAVSEYTKQEIRDTPLIKNKITVIHNGIANISFAEKTEARKFLFKKQKLPSSAFVVGTVAELHKNKGLIHALEAFSILFRERSHERSLPFVFAVVGDGEERRNLEQYVRENELEESVFFVGQKTEAPRYLKAFDVFLLPSIKEGFPYTVLEAGKAGLPVVASRVGGIAEVVCHEESGYLVEPRDSQGFAHALRILADDKTLRERHGKALKKHVDAHFSHSNMRRQTFACY